MKKTFSLAFSAFLAADAAAILIAGGLLPTGQAAMAVLAGLFPFAAAVELGWKTGLCVFAVSGALGVLCIPGGSAAILFCAFLGWYPVLRQFPERILSAPLRWIVKYGMMNLPLAIVLFLVRGLLNLDGTKRILVYAAANLVFFLYDLSLNRLTVLYSVKISPKIRRG